MKLIKILFIILFLNGCNNEASQNNKDKNFLFKWNGFSIHGYNINNGTKIKDEYVLYYQARIDDKKAHRFFLYNQPNDLKKWYEKDPLLDIDLMSRAITFLYEERYDYSFKKVKRKGINYKGLKLFTSFDEPTVTFKITGVYKNKTLTVPLGNNWGHPTISDVQKTYKHIIFNLIRPHIIKKWADFKKTKITKTYNIFNFNGIKLNIEEGKTTFISATKDEQIIKIPFNSYPVFKKNPLLFKTALLEIIELLFDYNYIINTSPKIKQELFNYEFYSKSSYSYKNLKIKIIEGNEWYIVTGTLDNQKIIDPLEEPWENDYIYLDFTIRRIIKKLYKPHIIKALTTLSEKKK